MADTRLSPLLDPHLIPLKLNTYANYILFTFTFFIARQAFTLPPPLPALRSWPSALHPTAKPRQSLRHFSLKNYLNKEIML
jgi:hypothetical protein